RDRAHMAAIGREGGHSRGARARAASTVGTVAAVAAGAAAVAGAAIAATRHAHSDNTRTDVSQGTGSQPFVRQVNDERNYESPSRNNNVSGGYGGNERPSSGSREGQGRDINTTEGGSLSDRGRL
ncbi:MAG TPA: hypothetical protein VEU30_11515, partial [Thermoanaerobaculia bacterium]|nr:hypothetical protein [Thermoanaerobaculia bacterium]